MPRITFTDLSLKALKVELRTDFWDTKTAGFGIRVGRNSKTFLVKRDNRRITIGRFGDWTLQEARVEAKKLLLQKSSSTRITVAAALDLFVSDHLKTRNRASTAKEHERILRKHLKPIFEKRVANVSKADILALLRQSNRRPSAANHLFTVARIFFRWCVRNDYIEHSPLASLMLPHRRPKRTRVLSDAELQSIWRACDGEESSNAEVATDTLPASFCTIVQLLVLTGQRRGEIAALQPSWINETEKMITLPAAATKNGREHRFPVGMSVQALLKPSEASPRLLFPARGTETKPFNGWSKSKVALDRLCGVKNWTLHDLRRTFRTIHGRIGTPPHIAERLINHVNGVASDVEQIYDLHTYLPEMRKATVAYEAEVMRILAQKAEQRAA